jgi:hypothetical protein
MGWVEYEQISMLEFLAEFLKGTGDTRLLDFTTTI